MNRSAPPYSETCTCDKAAAGDGHHEAFGEVATHLGGRAGAAAAVEPCMGGWYWIWMIVGIALSFPWLGMEPRPRALERLL